MSRLTHFKTKQVSELLPGEYVLLGSFWLKVESVEPGPMSRHVPKQLAIIQGKRQRWIETKQGWARSGDYDEPVTNDNSYLDSVHRYLPAD